ncbi:MAG: ankyrin repeat domain-containing protein [Planctomycetes bacterium]|nr:ankyrin repeat domain-containing protein [Planctomycetota bacterium]
MQGELVNEFVRAAHADLPKVKEMLAKEPALLNATWDWGGGDFEMAIGGAGHMGRRDIALFLIEQGARFDVFVAAMLGRLDLVKAALETHPNLKTSRGPHGISLSAHAKAGGEDAKAVLEYLQSIGAE